MKFNYTNNSFDQLKIVVDKTKQISETILKKA